MKDKIYSINFFFPISINSISMKKILLYLFTAILYTWPAFTQDSNSVLEFTSCFLVDCKPFQDDPRIEYAYLTVPENHDNPDGRNLRLAVIIIKASNGNPEDDPVIHLTGGPGGKALYNEKIELFRNHPFGQNRDIIMIDFRGIGLSEPEFCPELQDELGLVMLSDLTPTEATESTKRLFEKCFDSLKDRGLNLNMYNSATVVRDLEILRSALGIEKWNLWGISYGTRVAQTYMRDFPEAIRSAILDSPVPMGYPFWGEQVVSYRNSLNTFFAACKKNQEANIAFPNLEEIFYQVVGALKEDPLAIKSDVALGGYGYLNFQDMHLIIQQMLYNTKYYQAIPWLIKAIQNRDTNVFKNLIPIMGENTLVQSDAMLDIVVKYDNGLILNDYETDPADPLHNSLNYFDNIVQIVNNIDFITPDTIEILPVVSNIPSLILVGSIDPITRPEHARFLKKSLQRSYLFEFPGNGHGLTRTSDCAKGIGLNFLNNPDRIPDSNCLKGMEVDPINWITKINYNPRIYTLVSKMLFEKQWYLIMGALILFMGLLASVMAGLINYFSKNKKSFLPKVRSRNIIIRLSALAAVMLLGGLVWFVWLTGGNHGPLALFGIVKEAKFVLYLSFAVLVGTFLSLIWIIKTVRNTSTGGKILYILLGFSLLWCSVLIFQYQLFPF